MARDRYFNSAVLIPLVKIDGEYYLLFQKKEPLILDKVEISVSQVADMKMKTNHLKTQL